MLRFFRRDLNKIDADDDLRQELASHIAIESAEQASAGIATDEAERRARVFLGNPTRIAEEIREQSIWAGARRIYQDVRFGWRLLCRTPIWTTIVCATVATGIAISTAVFTVVHGVLLTPLPYTQPERIVTVQPVSPAPAREPFRPNPALWIYWKEHLASISDLALTRPVANFNFTGYGTPERLQGARISFNLPRVL